jgi:hypothetical protein
MEPHIYVNYGTKFATCLSASTSPNIAFLSLINILISMTSCLLLSHYHGHTEQWKTFRNASVMLFVINASIVLEAIVSSPTVWFVLIPSVRGISVLVKQTVFIFGLFKSLDRKNTDVLSDLSMSLKIPTQFKALEMGKVSFFFKIIKVCNNVKPFY